VPGVTQKVSEDNKLQMQWSHQIIVIVTTYKSGVVHGNMTVIRNG